MPILYQWNGNIDNLGTFLWLILQEIVQMILVLKKTNISLNWRYFRLRLFLIFEHNINCSMPLYDITMSSQEWRSFWTHRRLDWLINNLFSLTTKQYQSQRAALRVDSLTCGDLGFDESQYHMHESIDSLPIACPVSHPDDIWRKVIP